MCGSTFGDCPPPLICRPIPGARCGAKARDKCPGQCGVNYQIEAITSDSSLSTEEPVIFS
jgi:hypothetical protein